MVTSPGAAQDEPPGAVFLSSSTNDSRLSQCAVRRWLYDRFVRNVRNFLNSGFTATLWALIKRYWPSLLKAAHLSSICRRGEGVDDAPSETNFKTKASKQGPAGIGGCRIIIVTRKRRVRSPEWAGRYANLKDRR